MPKSRHARSLDLERYLSLYATSGNAARGGRYDDGDDTPCHALRAAVAGGGGGAGAQAVARSRQSSASSSYSSYQPYLYHGGGHDNYATRMQHQRQRQHGGDMQPRRRTHARAVDAVVLRRVFMLQHFQFIVRSDLVGAVAAPAASACATTPPTVTTTTGAQASPPSTPPQPPQPHGALAQAQRRLLECMRSSEAAMAWDAVRAVVMRAAPDDFECRICLDYPTAPRVTECGHLFCAPCILHYVRYQRAHDKPRLCPVCQATVVLPMLRPCVLHPVAPLRVGAVARFDLFRRARDSVQLLRGGGGDDQDDDAAAVAATAAPLRALLPYTHPASLQCRFVLATAAHEQQQRHLDTVSLGERLRRAVADAVRPLTEFDAGYEAALHEALREVRKDNGGNGGGGNEHAAGGGGSKQHVGTPPQMPRGGGERAGAMYELYAEGESGLPCYLHMLNVSMLRHDARLRGTALPSSVSGAVVELEALTQDEELRRSHKAFAHVPLHGTVHLCELDLRAVVLPATLQAFAAALRDRAARRRARERREEHDAAAAAAANDGRRRGNGGGGGGGGDGGDDAEEASWRRYVLRCSRGDATPPLPRAERPRRASSSSSPPPPSPSTPSSSVTHSPSVGATSHRTDSAMTTLQLPSVASLESGGDHGLPPNTLDTRQRATKRQDKDANFAATAVDAATTTTTTTASATSAGSGNCWAGGGGRRLLQRHHGSGGDAAPTVSTWGGHACVAATGVARPGMFAVPCEARRRAGDDDDAAAELRQARRLLAQYSVENARLRARLRACACERQCGARALDEAAVAAQRASPLPVGGRAGDNDGAAAAMQLQLCELQGKLRAYEEAWRQQEQRQQQQRASQTAASTPTRGDSGGEDVLLREVLRQCLRAADYLVKVCNACEHCRSAPHGLAAHCPRTRAECARRCLRAAARGSDAIDDGIESDDGNASALAQTLRDELFYCETVAVRLAAAQLLAVRGGGGARDARVAAARDSGDDDAGDCELAFHDLSAEAVASMPPSEALLKHLENAQLAHRVCVAKAMKAGDEPVDKCALTWGEVLLRYNQWAEYRPPFQDTSAQTRYSKYWTAKRQAAADK